MKMELFIANIIALIGSAIQVYAVSITDDSKMKKLVAASAIFFVIHFYLMNLPIAAGCTVVTVLRFYLSSFICGKVWILFALFYVFTSIFFSQTDVIHYFPIFASIIGTYAIFNMDGLRFRYLMVSLTFLWILYAIYSEVYIVALKEVVLFISSAYAISQLIKYQNNSSLKKGYGQTK